MQEELKRRDQSGHSILFMISQWCRNYFTPLYRWENWISGRLSNFREFDSFCCVTVLEKAEVCTEAEFPKNALSWNKERERMNIQNQKACLRSQRCVLYSKMSRIWGQKPSWKPCTLRNWFFCDRVQNRTIAY